MAIMEAVDTEALNPTIVTGRPSIYTPELAARICERISKGEAITALCDEDEMPSYQTLNDWAAGRTREAAAAGFPEAYARARDNRIARMADELQSIADDGTNDYVEKETRSGRVVIALDREHVARSDLRIKTRQWLLARMAPRDWGDRLAHQMLDENGKPAKLEITVTRVDSPTALDK